MSLNAQELVNADATVLLELEAALLEEPGRGADADAHDDEVCLERRAVLDLDGADLAGLAIREELGDLGLHVEFDALLLVVLECRSMMSALPAISESRQYSVPA